MNSSILTAIESLCDDIAKNTNPEENKKRAEAATLLSFAGIFTPSEYDDEGLSICSRSVSRSRSLTLMGLAREPCDVSRSRTALRSK